MGMHPDPMDALSLLIAGGIWIMVQVPLAVLVGRVMDQGIRRGSVI